jgi:hypothetical protein
MESISSENLPVVWHTLNKIELAISRLQERTVAIHNVDDFLLTPSGMEKLEGHSGTETLCVLMASQ